MALRRDALRVSPGAAVVMTLLLSLVLLPAISLSDDVLAKQEAALPLSSQSWRLAVEGTSLVTEVLLAVALYTVLLLCFSQLLGLAQPGKLNRAIRPVARWLARSQRLRPPLSFAR